MKKILFALASIWMLVSCANSATTYNVYFMNLSEEEKALFEAEIGVNDVAYLARLAEQYRVSNRSVINVYMLPDSTTLDDIAKFDKLIATQALNAILDRLPGVTKEMAAKIQSEQPEIWEGRGEGWCFEFGDNFAMTYMLWGDEVSYTSWPLNKDSLDKAVSKWKTNEESAAYSDTESKVIKTFAMICNGRFPGFYSGITKTLSTGQKVRINFTAELKQ